MALRVNDWRSIDATMAGGLTIAAIVEVSVEGYGPFVAACAAVVCMALNWRRSYPISVIAVGASVWSIPIMVGLVPSEAVTTPLAAHLIAVYSIARHASTGRALLGAGIAAAGSIASDLRLAHPSVSDFGFTVILISWPLFAGYALRGRALANAALAQRAELLEVQRDAQAREAVDQERARIARELHDVIAHGVGVMVVQAGAAEEVIKTHPDDAETALRAIRQTGREAMGDLRRLLAVLRDTPDDSRVTPSPGVAHLPALLDQVRAAGLRVELRTSGDPAELPAVVDLTAFRVMQEALTNVVKHAGPAQAIVRLDFRADEIRVEVSDNGRGGASPGDGGGHGLTGMGERVALCGGTLEAGPRDVGGYRVAARIPIAAPT